MSSEVLIAVVALLLIIIILLMIYLKKMKEEVDEVNNEAKSQNEVKSTNDANEKLDFEFLRLPLRIEKFDTRTLIKASTVVYETYSILDYKNRPNHEMDKKEWHAWQVSILIKLIKKDCSFIVPNKDVFPKSIENMHWNEVETNVSKIIEKFSQEVDLRKNKDKLCKEMVLTGREVGILLYYVINK